ncbi:Flp family type IVb pilin [Desulfopila inferna]|uniref:Flp family type IVb pilin n=1 Tax=Desulfopila inferna TaxID=468528 RepID=UPI0019652F6D|nr:Flp family type IVb pilin [Desulfopila inferna]MBM9603832.1 Flp family type IVb pilin [Desulfopila inferna]
MASILTLIKNFLVEEDGVTAIEYGLIAALIAVVIITILGTTGDALVTIFTTISDELTGAAAP